MVVVSYRVRSAAVAVGVGGTVVPHLHGVVSARVCVHEGWGHSSRTIQYYHDSYSCAADEQSEHYSVVEFSFVGPHYMLRGFAEATQRSGFLKARVTSVLGALVLCRVRAHRHDQMRD